MALVSQTVLSPAKINLMLRILSQRSDGYHELQTCFQILDWGDQLTFRSIEVHGGNQISIVGMPGVVAEDNLINQAADLLKPSARKHSDWLIQVDKQIPMGSGLGGGSSNAATALKFLNRAWDCGLSKQQLLALAKTLGADVPVFIEGSSCLATGIGEHLTPIEFDTPYILLMFPDCHISTAALFGDAGLNRSQVILNEDMIHDQAYWINDFFPLVLQRFAAVNKVYTALKAAMRLRLSGSGSTLFAVFATAAEAHAAQEQARTVCDARLVQATNHQQ